MLRDLFQNENVKRALIAIVTAVLSALTTYFTAVPDAPTPQPAPAVNVDK